MESGTVALSPRFFAKELKAYSDWRDAFWRELVQNSVDAGCRNIDVRFTGSEDEPLVTFRDDGPGMSRETLRNVYFQLGATTKGADDIGGFGRARMLTCFAHASYSVKSRDYLATGSGAAYQISPNPDGVTAGCEIGVQLLNSGGAVAMKQRLTAFQQVEDNLSALRVLSKEAEEEAKAVAAAEQALTLETERYKAGTDSYLNVITTQNIALSDERIAVTLLQRRMTSAVNLILALGGGWDASTLPTADQLRTVEMGDPATTNKVALPKPETH